MVRVMLAAAAAILLGACSEPFIVFSGGALNGEAADPPGDWTILDNIDTVQLETQPDDPYSVNIWAVGMGPLLYVHAGANRSSWVEHMEANPEVRVRVEGTLYDLRASRVEDQLEFTRFSDAYEEKYGLRPRNENAEEAFLFRLEAR